MVVGAWNNRPLPDVWVVVALCRFYVGAIAARLGGGLGWGRGAPDGWAVPYMQEGVA